MKATRAFLALLSGALLALGATTAAAGERWVLIDTQSKRATVFDGEIERQVFEPIAIGTRGAAELRLAGDMTTPLGEFHISHVNPASRFHIFLGINYPRLQDMDRALDRGLIAASDYWDMFDRMLRLGHSPQDTALGGHIGIHGLGAADPETHRLFDWTRGCVALTNEQIEQLAKLVSIGTRVVIR